MKKSLFIALEGIDGCGKSTQAALLSKTLEKWGHKVYSTFEPTDSAIGRMIRDIFSYRLEADHRVIAGLFVADRLEHILNKQHGLLQKRKEGYTIITDRYYLSSYAYQGAHMPMGWVMEANALSAQLLSPDLHIYINISPATGLGRISAGRPATELFETKENLQKVHQAYQEAIDKIKDKEHIFITNGERPPEKVAEDIRKAVWRLL